MPKIVRLPKKVVVASTGSMYPDYGQPRQNVEKDRESLMHLANSIKRKGLLKPILVERISRRRIEESPGLEDMLLRFDNQFGEEFEAVNGVARSLVGCGDDINWIVYGHRRFAAHWMSGIEGIKCKVVRDLTPFQRLALQLAEDSQEAIAPHEVAFDIVNVHNARARLLREESGNEEVNVPFTLLAYELGRSVKDIDRAFRFCALHAGIQEAVRDGFSYASATEIGRIRDKNVQMQVYRDQVREGYNLTKLGEIVSDIVGAKDGFLHGRVIKEIRSMHEGGENLDVLLRSFGQRANDELRGVLGLESKGEKRVLSRQAIKWAEQQTRGLKKSERILFYQRNRGEVSRRVNSEVTEQTLQTDLLGDPIKPEKSTYFIDERQRYYHLFDDLYKAMSVFVEFARVDESFLSRMRERGLRGALKNFARGLDDYLGVLVKDLDPDSESKQGKRGISVLSREKYDPDFNPSLKIIEIDLENLIPDPNNVRKTYSQKSLEELADSMRETGQLEELLVEKRDDGDYNIVVGHRRKKALALADIGKARCIVAEGLSAADKLAIQIIEDSQKPFSSSERAHSWYNHFKKYHAEMAEKGEEGSLSIHEFAKKIGKSASAVRAAFSYLSLPDKIKYLVDSGVINYSTAIELSHIPCSFDNKTMDYSYDPATDFYITPEQLFSGGENRYADLQFSLALRAAHNGMNLQQVKAMIKNCNPNGEQKILFKQEDLDRIVREGERESIVGGLIDKLKVFRGELGGLLNGKKRGDYSENVWNHRTLMGKYKRLRARFDEFYKLVA